MTFEKRRASLSPNEVQEGNKVWWTRNIMSYDWRGQIEEERFTPRWFDTIDARFIHSARLYATEHVPFDRLIPFGHLPGRRVLEIGCGMGLHSELMAQAGAVLTSIDLSPTSVEATSKRLALRGLRARVLQADAENLPFEDHAFDFVWSWGVIHHSSRTGRIVRHIARVLSPEGECRAMVYNREGAWAKGTYVRDYLLKAGLLRRSWEETLYSSSDGFSARFYVKEQFEDLFRTFFQDVSSIICGQDSDALPLPRLLRRLVMPLFSERYLRRAQARRGSFIVLTARRPE